MTPTMKSLGCRLRRLACRALAGLVCALPALAQPGRSVVAQAPEAVAEYRLRVVGGAAGLSQYVKHEEPFWTQRLAQLSQGRFRAEIVPYDRAGVPSMEMLRLVELGVVPMGTVIMSALGARYPQYSAADLPGLNPDMSSLRSHVAAFRPYLEKSLREQHGVRLLAIYAYPAQVLFCKRPVTRLSDLQGRRTRVSSADQADFVMALGGEPVRKSFARIVPSLENNSTECSITGTMSGHLLGLSRVANHLYPMPLSWALSVFVVNEGAWLAMPEVLRSLLGREMPRLEQAVWEAAERETAEGIACNRGQSDCSKPSKGGMAVAQVASQDERLRTRILETEVLRRWQQRCRIDCLALWQQIIEPVRGLGPKLP
jgi:TRAP-type C4-dicarboxylate transport system substrate-binding protein